MKASDFVAQYLAARGVTHVFELVGGMITHLIDSISATSEVKIISCHHEQAAAFAAEGHARVTRLPGIALATSGPGATNLLTGIGSCFFDSIPTVFVTGQVNTYELKGGLGIRQLGFQETDIVAIAKPICKSAVQVRSSSELPAALDAAFRLALEGRQGPCLVDIPMNVQAELIDDGLADQFLQLARLAFFDTTKLHRLAVYDQFLKDKFNTLLRAIDQAERPILLMGGGCAADLNRKPARLIAEMLGVPVVLSLMAVDLLPHEHPQRVGFIGSYGNRWANKALATADLLVVLGSRLDIRQTGSDTESFCEGKEIWQIDIDPEEVGVRIQPQHSICCSILSAAQQLATLSKTNRSRHCAWQEQIDDLRQQFPAWREYQGENDELNPIRLLEKLSSIVINPCHYITDVGQHQMWAAQSLHFKSGDRFLTSGGMGAMGFGLPAAIGSAFANERILNVLITGDGSFQVNIQELETARRNQLNIKIILFNNRCHGMVRQFQESYFCGRVQSTVIGYSAPNFVAVANAYGVPARCIKTLDKIDEALNWLLHSNGPVLLEVPLPVNSKVYPKLAFGRRFGEMEPDASPVKMEST